MDMEEEVEVEAKFPKQPGWRDERSLDQDKSHLWGVYLYVYSFMYSFMHIDADIRMMCMHKPLIANTYGRNPM